MTQTTSYVKTLAGTVRGIQREGSAAFLGIPFAEAPIGDLRFAAPVPHASWAGVRDATGYGATPQRQALSEVTLIPEPSVPGESTLNLNVFTPRPGETGAKLPVLVWIHGGGYVSGSGASPWYDGASFNRDGIVTVSVSYRLGFDGFGWIRDAPQNRGVLDWILALEWVRDNITSFGGDPSRVTIAGQSAGGGAVLTLLAVPRAARLFRQAISLSGATSDLPLADAERLGHLMAQRAGVEPTRAGLSVLGEDRILELQNQIGDVRGSSDQSEDPLPGIVALASDGLKWGPVVDGDLLPAAAMHAARRGIGNDKRLMIGTTDNEFNMVLAPHEEALTATDPAPVLSALGLSGGVINAYLQEHPGLTPAQIIGQVVTDKMFRAPARNLAEARAEAGAPAWLYRFSWPSPTIGGACHCIDVPFFFDCLDSERVEALTGPNPPAALAGKLHSAAVQFIAGCQPGWPAYDTDTREVRIFDAVSTVKSDGYADAALLTDAALT
ncbi:carboxylesterase/lipase family protein [Arthrobacter sp. AQ5-06]|nr:carboxylesterase/lipase family protein [Arthrobacter sp. AQ5-06]